MGYILLGKRKHVHRTHLSQKAACLRDAGTSTSDRVMPGKTGKRGNRHRQLRIVHKLYKFCSLLLTEPRKLRGQHTWQVQRKLPGRSSMLAEQRKLLGRPDMLAERRKLSGQHTLQVQHKLPGLP